MIHCTNQPSTVNIIWKPKLLFNMTYLNIFIVTSVKLAQTLSIVACIRVVSISNIGWGTNYTDSGFSWVSMASLGKREAKTYSFVVLCNLSLSTNPIIQLNVGWGTASVVK
jgi:hypothetical protein